MEKLGLRVISHAAAFETFRGFMKFFKVDAANAKVNRHSLHMITFFRHTVAFLRKAALVFGDL